MKNTVAKLSLLALLICICSSVVSAQGVNRNKNAAYKAYYDSLKAAEYNYPLPMFGKKAYKKGFDLQNAWGISAVYFTQTQEININRILLGYNGGTKADFSGLIGFGPTIAQTNALTVRPDVWVFPFLNVYGIFGGGNTSTAITLLKPVSFETEQYFNATSFGLGATLTGAVGPIWVAWDNNYNFVDVDVLVEPIPAYNSSLRVGHNFLDPSRPDRSMAVWVGTFYQVLQSDTKGSIAVSDVFPHVGSGETIQDLRDWAATLDLAQRIVANAIIDKIEEKANGSDISNATIDYELQKEVAAPFNLIFGAQYQINKNWIVRAEMGVFGKRSQFMLNLNYRFKGFVKR